MLNTLIAPRRGSEDLTAFTFRTGRRTRLISQAQAKQTTMATMMARELHEGWTFAKVGGASAHASVQDGEWLPAQSFPTTVHVELLAHKRIQDPVRPLALLCYSLAPAGSLVLRSARALRRTPRVGCAMCVFSSLRRKGKA